MCPIGNLWPQTKDNLIMADKWHRQIDDEQLDREIAELEAQFAPPPPDPVVTTPEEDTWKKRYGDLRSHSQRQYNDIQKQLQDAQKKIDSLTNQVQNKTELPKTKEELEAWAQQYPDVYDFVRTTSILETQNARQEIQDMRRKLEEERLEETKTNAIRRLHELHPDFFNDIKDSPEFETWLNSKSKRTRDALYENDTDADAAAEVVSMYKYETNYGKPAKQQNITNQQEEQRRIAADTRLRERNNTPAVSGEYLFSESQINAMSFAEFSAKETEIDAAMKSGKVFMDITGGAR